MKKKTAAKTAAKVSSAVKRSYLKQSDVPATSLDDALRVPKAIFDNYGGVTATPMQVAKALDVDPGGAQMRLLTGAAIAFGLTEGGAQSSAITTTDLARRILKPKEEGQDLIAKREAILRPRVFREFLQKYDTHPFPRKDLGQNVLEDMGVPKDKTEGVLGQIDASARSVGFLEEIKGKSYVTLLGVTPSAVVTDEEANDESITKSEKADEHDTSTPLIRTPVPPPAVQPKSPEFTAAIADDVRRKRVFITHSQFDPTHFFCVGSLDRL